MKLTPVFRCFNKNGDIQIPERAKEYFKTLPEVVEITVKAWIKQRTLPQNAKLWAMLTDLSNSIDYPPRSEKFRSKEIWKELMTAAYQIAINELECVPAPESEHIIAIGLSTRKMKTKEMKVLIEYIYSYGTKRGVEWSETKKLIDKTNR